MNDQQSSSELPTPGAPMHRDGRPMTLTYKGEAITFDVPAWYCSASDESIHAGVDTKLSDRMLNRLKARVAGPKTGEDAL